MLHPNSLYRCSDHTAIGEACFVAEGDGDERGVLSNACPKCGIELDPDSQAQSCLAHFAMHLRHDPTIDKKEERCGTCLRLSLPGVCEYYLRKGKGAEAGFLLDLTRTTCVNKFKFNYKTASKSSTSSPSSNVPLQCPICGPGSPAVWRYSMEAHFIRHHPLSVSIPRYSSEWVLSNFEEHEMHEMWKKRNNKKAKKKGKGKANVPLVISEAHSSRMAFRYVAFGPCMLVGPVAEVCRQKLG